MHKINRLESDITSFSRVLEKLDMFLLFKVQHLVNNHRSAVG